MIKQITFILFFAVILALPGVYAQADTQNICCEKTVNNLYCQQVPSTQCAAGSKQAPTSCESTSFCKPGVCYGTTEGICMGNTPQVVCNLNNSKWSEESPPQCDLGCCVLGDQAAFVSLVRCKRLASVAGLPINYNKNIGSESACILSVQNQDKGACVYEYEFEKTCSVSTREICSQGINGTGAGTFYKGKLCTAPELGTICAPTTKTACVPGKDGVYFVDSCGNPANVYDSSKIRNTNDFDVAYWSTIVVPEQSCNAGSANANSKSCGNCNYLAGSICRKASTGNSPAQGNNICTSLNCVDSKGTTRIHGESWCVYDDAGKSGINKNSVGSRFYKHICINGEEVLEQCADFRQEECIQDSIKTPNGAFSQAACRVNRWQDCTQQLEKLDCENKDRRDCSWNEKGAVCLPINPPGLKFWEGEAAKTVCEQGNTQCSVVFEKGLFGGKECKQNCQCLTEGWKAERAGICSALGDCGPNVNWVNQAGYKEGYKVEQKPAE